MVLKSQTGSMAGRQEQEARQEEGVRRSGQLLQSIAIMERLQEGGVTRAVVTVVMTVMEVMAVSAMVVIAIDLMMILEQWITAVS